MEEVRGMAPLLETCRGLLEAQRATLSEERKQLAVLGLGTAQPHDADGAGGGGRGSGGSDAPPKGEGSAVADAAAAAAEKWRGKATKVWHTIADDKLVRLASSLAAALLDESDGRLRQSFSRQVEIFRVVFVINGHMN